MALIFVIALLHYLFLDALYLKKKQQKPTDDIPAAAAAC